MSAFGQETRTFGTSLEHRIADRNPMVAAASQTFSASLVTGSHRAILGPCTWQNSLAPHVTWLLVAQEINAVALFEQKVPLLEAPQTSEMVSA